jgi:hypothetical protein
MPPDDGGLGDLITVLARFRGADETPPTLIRGLLPLSIGLPLLALVVRGSTHSPFRSIELKEIVLFLSIQVSPNLPFVLAQSAARWMIVIA